MIRQAIKQLVRWKNVFRLKTVRLNVHVPAFFGVFKTPFFIRFPAFSGIFRLFSACFGFFRPFSRRPKMHFSAPRTRTFCRLLSISEFGVSRRGEGGWGAKASRPRISHGQVSEETHCLAQAAAAEKEAKVTQQESQHQSAEKCTNMGR